MVLGTSCGITFNVWSLVVDVLRGDGDCSLSTIAKLSDPAAALDAEAAKQ